MNSSDSFYLIDILNLINFNLDCICEQKHSPMIVKHFKNSIMGIIKTLEAKKHFEYMYICILLITSRICESIVKNYLTAKEGSTEKLSDNNSKYFRRNYSVYSFITLDVYSK
jgi:hypothetical protein